MMDLPRDSVLVGSVAAYMYCNSNILIVRNMMQCDTYYSSTTSSSDLVSIHFLLCDVFLFYMFTGPGTYLSLRIHQELDHTNFDLIYKLGHPNYF